MDNRYYVHKLDKPVNWVVEVPGSKSVTNRALFDGSVGRWDNNAQRGIV